MAGAWMRAALGTGYGRRACTARRFPGQMPDGHDRAGYHQDSDDRDDYHRRSPGDHGPAAPGLT